MSIEWKESLKIGHPEIDKQHQRLFELTNALMAADDVSAVRRLLMQLYKHTREHFELEEALMRQLNFPDINAHTDGHNRLLARLNGISQEVGQGLLDKSAVATLMGDWALRHISHDDARLSAFIAK